MIREKERGTVEQLLMTPASTLEVITAKMVPLFILLMTMVLLVIVVARLVFGVPFLISYLSRFMSLQPGDVISKIGDGLQNAFLMAWEVWWALVLGFAISAIVQAWVPRQRIESALAGDGPRPLAWATGLGAASSSCSYAAIAIAKSLFQKGASAAEVDALDEQAVDPDTRRQALGRDADQLQRASAARALKRSC